MRPATPAGAPVAPVRRALATAGLAAALALAATTAPPAPAAAAPADAERLYLVTLAGPGTAGSDRPVDVAALRTADELDSVLARVGSPDPVYRWDTALRGAAVRLTDVEADAVAGDPRVVLVERDEVRRLAGRAAAAAGAARAMAAPARGGRGTVIGVVDSGITPESPAFASLPSLGPAPDGFRGRCAAGAGWSPSSCRGKIAAAQWYVAGFGRDRLRAGASLSPRDDDGHGTQVASVAAGNADVAVRVPGQRSTTVGGRAPDARLAVYKACWSAPDPDDDGCSTADLVAAVDRAVADGVDVLSLSVGGPDEVDTVERALLGAAEADVVVLGAAGNRARSDYAAHPSPWVTTVGGASGRQPRGEVRVADGPRLAGASAARPAVERRPLVLATAVRAAGADVGRARVCAPGSLDAGEVAGTVVLCERGRVGRVDKSATVSLAGGEGMVLVNRRAGSTYADFHAVPTVHLGAGAGRRLTDLVRRQPATRVSLVPDGLGGGGAVAPWSATGDPVGGTLKPDVVAPATGLLGAVPGSGRDARWDVASGTSAATAWTAGVAADLRSRHPGWSAVEVRSVLATTADPVRAPSRLASGAGLVDGGSQPVRLVYPQQPGAYRAWLDGDRRRLNPASVLLTQGTTSDTRRIRNTAGRALYFSSRARGFDGPVSVRPAAVRLGPGDTATFEVRATGRRDRLDDGVVVWRGGDGSRSRIPVVLSR